MILWGFITNNVFSTATVSAVFCFTFLMGLALFAWGVDATIGATGFCDGGSCCMVCVTLPRPDLFVGTYDML